MLKSQMSVMSQIFFNHNLKGVIPAKLVLDYDQGAGIQKKKTGFRTKSGMTNFMKLFQGHYMRKQGIVFLIILTVSLGGFGCAGNDVINPDSSKPGPEFEFKDLKPEPEPEPELEFKDLKGNTYNLSELKGKILIFNFWAPWSGPCQSEAPYLNGLNEKYKDQGVVVFGVVVSYRKEEEIGKKIEEWKIEYPIVNGEDYPELKRRFRKVRAIPTSFIINQEGRIYKQYIGFSMGTPLAIEEDIKKLLSKYGKQEKIEQEEQKEKKS